MRRLTNWSMRRWGPLPWLLEFANIGFDDRHPRGPDEELDRSRALGYFDAETGTVRRGEVFFDPESPFSSEPCEPWGEFVTQEDPRGITKTWLRMNVGGKEVMIPDTRGLDAPMTWELLQGFWAKHPPRPMMPVPEGIMNFVLPQRLKRVGGEHGPDTWPVEELGGTPHGEEILRCLQVVRFEVRVFLNRVRHRCREIDTHRALSPQVVIEFMVNTIIRACLDKLGTSPTWPDVDPKGEDPVMVEGQLANIIRSIWENAAPVSMQMKKGEHHYFSNGLPGIAWAEILNLAERRPLWKAVQCCRWCGRFFLDAPGRMGRPREFCSDRCKNRFHGLAFNEPR